MNPLDEQIKTLTALLRAKGGHVGIDPNAPDDVKEAFLEMILRCPECREKVMGKHNGQAN